MECWSGSFFNIMEKSAKIIKNNITNIYINYFNQNYHIYILFFSIFYLTIYNLTINIICQIHKFIITSHKISDLIEIIKIILLIDIKELLKDKFI